MTQEEIDLKEKIRQKNSEKRERIIKRMRYIDEYKDIILERLMKKIGDIK